MFAVFFLVLLMRYSRKKIISLILLVTCISLHRLTGIMAILFMVTDYLFQKKIEKKYIFFGIFAALITYIPTFHIQIIPLIEKNPVNYLFFEGAYGVGLSGIKKWIYEIPLILMALYGLIKSSSKKKLNTYVVV